MSGRENLHGPITVVPSSHRPGRYWDVRVAGRHDPEAPAFLFTVHSDELAGMCQQGLAALMHGSRLSAEELSGLAWQVLDALLRPGEQSSGKTREGA